MLLWRSTFEIHLTILLLIVFHQTQQAKTDLKESGEKGFKEMAASKLLTCEFEVFGKVQGVFFRKNTEKQAKKLGLRGWVKNTDAGTVKGQLEGPQREMNEMKLWLETKGSPKSRIDKAIFTEMREISTFACKNFSIKH